MAGMDVGPQERGVGGALQPGSLGDTDHEGGTSPSLFSRVPGRTQTRPVLTLELVSLVKAPGYTNHNEKA